MIGGLRRFKRDRVVVHTRQDSSIRGVLVGTYRDCVVLSHAEWLHEAQEEAKIQGSAVVLRENIDWIQVLGGE